MCALVCIYVHGSGYVILYVFCGQFRDHNYSLCPWEKVCVPVCVSAFTLRHLQEGRLCLLVCVLLDSPCPGAQVFILLWICVCAHVCPCIVDTDAFVFLCLCVFAPVCLYVPAFVRVCRFACFCTLERECSFCAQDLSLSLCSVQLSWPELLPSFPFLYVRRTG